MDVDLVVVEGRPLGAVVPVKVSPFVIGRDPGCQLRPKNPAASGRHSAIFLREDQVVVGDLGSTNGTLVNDHCLHAGEEVPLVDGDRLQVGQLIFVVRIASKVPGVESSLQGWLTPTGDGARRGPEEPDPPPLGVEPGRSVGEPRPGPPPRGPGRGAPEISSTGNSTRSTGCSASA